MAERTKIGIAVVGGENWAGGYYYILNTLKALDTLSVEDKPEIYIFYTDFANLHLIKEINYPYISYLPLEKSLSVALKLANRISNKFIGHLVFKSKPYSLKTVKFIFPYNYPWIFPSLDKLNKIYWIPDFQHIYYPIFFSEDEIKKRDHMITKISETTDGLVLSSQSSFNDYKKAYPHYKNKIYVIPFASILPNFSSINWQTLKAKYQITEPFFFVPNQFWKHKNHIIVLKALHLLKMQEIKVLVLFSGKEDNYNDHNQSSILKKYVKENDLKEYVRFLGFIDRKEQLSILKHAVAVVQPSLFEGWSTVIEDSKALNQFVIASDISVNREQLTNNCYFFNPTDEQNLADLLKKIIQSPPEIKILDYSINIERYAELLKKLCLNKD